MHLVLLALVPVVFALHVHVLYSDLKFELQIAELDAMVSTLVLGLSLWGIILVIRAYPTTAGVFLYALVAALLISFATTYAEYDTLKFWVFDTNEPYKIWLKQTLPIRFLFVMLFNSWMATNAAMRKIITISENRYQLQADASILLKEAELFKLRQQLQPHFLYNSLNSINALVIIAPDKAQEMIGKLSDFLRSSIKREAEDLLKVGEELVYIQSFLDIESIRFGDRLAIAFENDFDENAVLPPFLLQPIIENAIKFGLYGNTGNVKIEIGIKQEGPELVITIINPYDKNTQPPRGTGFGLESIRRRLWLLYSRTDLLETNKDDDYFTTILKVPQPDVQGNINR